MGIGYAWNSWLRFDVTGEYRTKAGFKATGSYTDFCSGATCFDINTGNISSAVFLGNAYVDLGTWWCLTPFIGAGVGGARNMISGVQDQGIIGSNGTVGFGYTFNDSAQWNLAWDVTAGLKRQSQDRFQLAVPEYGLAANCGGSLPEHGGVPRRLLHAAKLLRE
jgi:opacity protein-like surface antigen